MTRFSMALAVALAVLACGSEKGKTGPTTSLPKVDIVPKSSGRTVVATVDGTPVYADCVTEQAQAMAISARAALDHCIEFELLARVAYERYGSLKAAHDTQRRESVRVLLREQFEPKSDEPTDIPREWLRANVWNKGSVQKLYNHPEFRVADFALSEFSQKPVGAAHDKTTRDLADDWHRAMKGKRLTPTEFQRIARAVGNEYGTKYHTTLSYQTPKVGRSVQAFADALFALDVGELSPVVKTKHGYFVIILREVIPAKSTSFEDAVVSMQKNVYSNWRPIAFGDYVAALQARADVDLNEEALKKVRLDLPSEFRVPTNR